MNTTLSEAIVLGDQMEKIAEAVKHLNLVIAPPSVFIYPIFERLRAKPNNFYLGIQNAMWENEGAYTGEVSLSMVRGVCRYVILGHSERRKIFSENGKMIRDKVAFAISCGMNVILCVGEQDRFHLEDHYQSEIKRMSAEGGVLMQVKDALDGIRKSDLDRISIAYEPVWAIGTANAATGAYAAAVAHIIKQFIGDNFGKEGNGVRVLYGGSVTSANTAEFMGQPSIDGLLVGGASLKSGEFAKICKISSEAKSGRIV